MAGGFIIFAGSLAAIGYVIATLVIRAADQDMARTWAAFNDDPRPAQLLNPGGSVSLDPANGGGGDRARRGRGYALKSDIAHRKEGL